MIYFGKYLKDYLEYNNISQTEFATRIGITQKHMNEIINGKTRITLEMAGNIERLTGIKSEFIINVENSRILKENILKQYGNIDNLKKEITINKNEKCDTCTFLRVGKHLICFSNLLKFFFSLFFIIWVCIRVPLFSHFSISSFYFII